jgi:hypothetical protein
MPSPTIEQVRSFLYVITMGADATSFAQMGNVQVDMLIFGGSPSDPALDRSIIDPGHNKLIISYSDLTEASAYVNPSLFSPARSPILGAVNPDFPTVYSVQYWDPVWRQELFTRVDQLIAQGFDGVFLDSGSGDSEWAPGNSLGNPVRASRVQDLGDLLGAIHDHIVARNLGHSFYVIVNNPTSLALQTPSALAAVDAIFNESDYLPTQPDLRTWLFSTVAPAYAAAHKVVFGNNYQGSADVQVALPAFNDYAALGWVSSAYGIVDGVHPENNYTNGLNAIANYPREYLATPANPTAIGAQSSVSLISGGVTAAATLIGGGRENYFIGGPGQNTITGGAAGDYIYAHPESAALKNVLVLELDTEVVGVPSAPGLTVLVNGQTALTANDLRGTFGARNHLQVNLARFGAIHSVEILGSNITAGDPSHFSNIHLESVMFEGHAVSLAAAQYSNGSGFFGNNAVLNNGAHVTFDGSAFTTSIANTSDSIDGGGGVNTVYYRGVASDFAITVQADGALTVATSVTAEGPDTVRNIQSLVFSDRTMPLPSAAILRGEMAILREQPFSSHEAALTTDISAKLSSGQMTTDAAIVAIVQAARATSSVATLSYEFFTGQAPGAPGMDYLVSPSGPNPNNLNSAYFQSFSLENRYINFAVNLGKAGEGAAAFNAAFASLSLFEATRTAYTTIFGGTPSDAKLHAILDPTTVLGGVSYSRADYFAYYGQDGPTGIGTKAAMVGFLLAEAVKADLGSYALSNDAFLAAVATDNAPFAVDFVGLYGKPDFVFHPG